MRKGTKSRLLNLLKIFNIQRQKRKDSNCLSMTLRINMQPKTNPLLLNIISCSCRCFEEAVCNVVVIFFAVDVTVAVVDVVVVVMVVMVVVMGVLVARDNGI